MKILYHKADFDGLFCSRIARHFLGTDSGNIEYIPWDYGDPIPRVSDIDKVLMMDISIHELMGHPRLTWIDHHASAIAKYSKDIPGYRIDGVAACRLTWQWFLKQERDALGMIWLLPDKTDYVERRVTEPRAVRLAGEYDIWDRRDPDAALFQHGLKSRELTPGMWDTMLEDTPFSDGQKHVTSEALITDLLTAGKSVQYAKNQEDASVIKMAGFTVQWEGLTFLACNHASYNSFLFLSGLEAKHDACLGFAWRKDKWVVSLYHAPGHEDLDLSIIASRHGGGGHRGACGFITKKLPFNL